MSTKETEPNLILFCEFISKVSDIIRKYKEGELVLLGGVLCECKRIREKGHTLLFFTSIEGVEYCVRFQGLMRSSKLTPGRVYLVFVRKFNYYTYHGIYITEQKKKEQ